MKYKLFKKRKSDGLHRIKALIDIPGSNVRKGTLGGLVRDGGSLSQSGSCWITKEAKVIDNAYVCDDAWVDDKAVIKGGSVIKDRACIYGNAIVDWSIIGGHACIYGKAKIMASSDVRDHCRISGDTVLRRVGIFNRVQLASGLWVESPLFIVVGSYRMYPTSPNSIQIGCTSMYIDDWRATWRSKAKNEGLDDAQVEMMRDGFEMIAKQLKRLFG